MKKLRIIPFFFIALTPFILNGCATVKPIQSKPTQLTHVYSKNYELGQELKAYVGMEVVKVKDYYVRKSEIKGTDLFSAD